MEIKDLIIVIATVNSFVLALLFILGVFFIYRIYRKLVEKIRSLNGISDEKEMTGDAGHQTAAGTEANHGNIGIYTDVSEGDIIIHENTETGEDRDYCEPDEYLKDRPSLEYKEIALIDDKDEVATCSGSKETMKQLSGSGYIHPCTELPAPSNADDDKTFKSNSM